MLVLRGMWINGALPGLRRTRLGGRVIAILLCIAGWPCSSAAALEVVDADPDGIELGLGWDSQTGTVRPSRCVNFAPVQEGGQTITLDLSEISDSAELAEHMGVSASLSVGGIGASGSAGLELVHDAEVSTTATNFSLRVAVTNGVMFAGPPRRPAERRFAFSELVHEKVPEWIKPEPEPSRDYDSVQLSAWALKLLNRDGNNNEALFRRYCGDHYIAAIWSGVEALALITFDAETKEDREKLHASITATYSLASGDASLDKDHSDLAKKSHLNVHYTQVGGADGEIPTTQEDLVEKLRFLTREASAAPHFYDMGVIPYADLPNAKPLTEEKPVADDPASLLMERDLELASLYRDIGAVLEHPKKFRAFPDLLPPRLVTLGKLQDRVLKLRRVIARIRDIHMRQELAELNTIDTTASTSLASLSEVASDITSIDGPIFITKAGSYDALFDLLMDWLQTFDVRPLRLQLPLPGHADKQENQSWSAAIVDYYVGRKARRVCQDRPTARDCLSREDLAALEAHVVSGFSLDAVAPGAVGFFCSMQREAPGCLEARGKEMFVTPVPQSWTKWRIAGHPTTDRLTIQRDGDEGAFWTRWRQGMDLRQIMDTCVQTNSQEYGCQFWYVKESGLATHTMKWSEGCLATSEPDGSVSILTCEGGENEPSDWFFVPASHLD